MMLWLLIVVLQIRKGLVYSVLPSGKKRRSVARWNGPQNNSHSSWRSVRLLYTENRLRVKTMSASSSGMKPFPPPRRGAGRGGSQLHHPTKLSLSRIIIVKSRRCEITSLYFYVVVVIVIDTVIVVALLFDLVWVRFGVDAVLFVVVCISVDVWSANAAWDSELGRQVHGGHEHHG